MIFIAIELGLGQRRKRGVETFTFELQTSRFSTDNPMKKPLASPDLNREAKLKAFDRLLTIMDELRENCPGIKSKRWRPCAT